jgi:hypothetical protein
LNILLSQHPCLHPALPLPLPWLQITNLLVPA